MLALQRASLFSGPCTCQFFLVPKKPLQVAIKAESCMKVFSRPQPYVCIGVPVLPSVCLFAEWECVCVCVCRWVQERGAEQACMSDRRREGRADDDEKANAYARENNRVGVVGSAASSPLLPNAFCVFLLHQPTSLPPSSFPSTLCSREVGGTFAHGSRKRRRRKRGKTRGKKKKEVSSRDFSSSSKSMLFSGGGEVAFRKRGRSSSG